MADEENLERKAREAAALERMKSQIANGCIPEYVHKRETTLAARCPWCQAPFDSEWLIHPVPPIGMWDFRSVYPETTPYEVVCLRCGWTGIFTPIVPKPEKPA